MNPAMSSNLRVMSTPTWHVPYYQRAFRHPVFSEESQGDLLYALVPVSDCDVVLAKELLKLNGQGYVVEAIEQTYQLDSYRTEFKDSGAFSRAYTDDLLDCLGIVNEQNVKILGENDLSDVFN